MNCICKHQRASNSIHAVTQVKERELWNYNLSPIQPGVRTLQGLSQPAQGRLLALVPCMLRKTANWERVRLDLLSLYTMIASRQQQVVNPQPQSLVMGHVGPHVDGPEGGSREKMQGH